MKRISNAIQVMSNYWTLTIFTDKFFEVPTNPTKSFGFFECNFHTKGDYNINWDNIEYFLSIDKIKKKDIMSDIKKLKLDIPKKKMYKDLIKLIKNCKKRNLI